MKSLNSEATATAVIMDEGYNPVPQLNRPDLILIACISLIGLAVRLPYINQGLWIDEIKTLVHFARAPVLEILSKFDMNNHVLYSLCAHFSISWLGESAWTLRLPALLFGVGAISATYYLGRQLASRSEATLAALFMTLNYHFVWFSQNARGYTGLALGAVIATILFIQLVARKSPPARLIFAYAVVSALSVWIHLTAVVVIFVHGVVWLVLCVRAIRTDNFSAVAPPAKALFLGIFISVLMYAPMMGGTLENMEVVYQGSLVEKSPLVEYGTWKWAWEEFGKGLTRSMPGGWLFSIVLTATLLYGAISYLRQGYVAACLLLLPAMITPVLIFFFAGYFFPRFIFSYFPFLMLVAVRGGFELAAQFLRFLSRRQIVAIGIVLAMISATSVPGAWKPKQDFRAVADFIAQHRQPGDQVVCVRLTHFALSKYLGMNCKLAMNLETLENYDKRREKTWLIYSVPKFIAAQKPEMWAWIRVKAGSAKEYELVKTFEGTLSDGDIVVLLKQDNTTGKGQ